MALQNLPLDQSKTMQQLNLNIDNGLATVTLNRPEKKNALSEILFEELFEVGRNLQKTEH